MNKAMIDAIIQSIRDSIAQASEFMEDYESNEKRISSEIDARDYNLWADYRATLVAAYREILKMKVELERALEE